LRAIQENFEEGYVKAKEKKKKEWNERRMPITSKRKKVSIEERHNKC
jgi:hypothetical protein